MTAAANVTLRLNRVRVIRIHLTKELGIALRLLFSLMRARQANAMRVAVNDNKHLGLHGGLSLPVDDVRSHVAPHPSSNQLSEPVDNFAPLGSLSSRRGLGRRPATESVRPA